jgi:hypothetical protein
MAFQYSPKIITNELILYFDSYNQRSYDGTSIWKSLKLSNISATISGENSRTETGSLSFNGIDTEVTYGTSTSFNFTIDSDFTLVIHFKLRQFGPGALLMNGHTDGALGFDRTSNGIRFGCRPQVNDVGTARTITFNCELNRSYVAVGVHDGSNKEIRLYINGELIGTNIIDSVGEYDNAVFRSGKNNRLIGSNDDSVYMNGELSFFMLYDKVLDSTEINRNFKALGSRNLSLDVGYPNWQINNISGSQFFNAYKNDIMGFDTTETTLFGSISGSTKFRGGTLGPNGKIYCTPANFTQVMTIDTNNDNIGFFGSLSGNSKWSGGALAPNGKIYCAPNNETKILVIDTNNDTTYFIGTFSTTTFKWNDAILAPNGKIYFIPGAATTILVVDPTDDSITEIGNFDTTGGKWNGGVLAPNGKIYGIPSVATTILIIDTNNDAINTVGNFTGSAKWSGGALAPNGKIYCAPRDASRVLEIDTQTDTGTLVGTTYTGSAKWFGGTVGPNGRVYFAPTSQDSVLEIDPNTGNTSLVFTSLGLNTYGCVLSPKGQIYFVPLGTTQILKMGQVVTQNPDKVLSRYINTF